MTKRINLTQTSSRPDLQVVFQLPGAYIIKDGVPVPDLNDEAMMEREKRNVKREMDKMKEDLPAEAGSKEEKTNN